MFAAIIREGMANCLTRLGRNDEAKKWMAEAAEIRATKLSKKALMAGWAKRVNPKAAAAPPIQEEKKKTENDAEYWEEQVGYHRERNETAQMEEAFKTGLSIRHPGRNRTNE